VAILQIQVVEGEGAVHVPGVRSTHPLVIAITDDAGRPVPGAAVTIHLPDTGPGGSFGNGLRTHIAMTDAHGRATVKTFQANRTAGRFQIRIVASKEQARAGTVSFQYIGLPGTRATKTASATNHRKWIAIAAAAGGGTIAGVLASRSGTTPGTGTVVPLPPPVLTIGTPAISVGKP
jgi:hypothetical protein